MTKKIEVKPNQIWMRNRMPRTLVTVLDVEPMPHNWHRVEYRDGEYTRSLNLEAFREGFSLYLEAK